jgi:integrase
MRTNFPQEIGEIGIPDTVSTHETPENGDEIAMAKWPRKVKHRNKVLAKIYRPCHGRDSYRVTWYAAGKRQMKSFPTYSGKGGAKEFAEALVRELAKQSQAVMLTPGQATDALAAIERLGTFREATGKRVSLLTAVSEFCEVATKLPGHTLREIADGFHRTVASVTRMDLAQAAEEFIAAADTRTRTDNGRRAQSEKYHYNRAIQLRRFAGSFSGYAVCDLGKHDLDGFISSEAVADLSAKSRNHHRAVIRQFIEWAARKDYLPVGHRLLECDGLRPERANTAEVHFYTAKEFRALLEAAEGPMRAMIAIGGLTGLRTQELLRLDWADVWRIKSHIEVTAGKAKTRQRRLVVICPALAAWLHPFRTCTEGKLCTLHEVTWQQHFVKLCGKAGVKRKANGLRHGFCSYHFALHANENLTAQQAGNSPTMIHAHYKGLVTKKEAKAWFAVKPARTANNIVELKGIAP